MIVNTILFFIKVCALLLGGNEAVRSQRDGSRLADRGRPFIVPNVRLRILLPYLCLSDLRGKSKSVPRNRHKTDLGKRRHL